jgi:Domain of unknown function (DUF4383)
MAEGAYGKLGIARVYALVFGVVYIAVAVIEFIVGEGSEVLGISNFTPTTVQTVVHLAVGVIVFGSFLAGESAARTVARIIGVVFVALTIYGFIAPDSLGDLLGYGRQDIPLVYNIIHAATAVLALFAGFAGSGGYRRTEAAA